MNKTDIIYILIIILIVIYLFKLNENYESNTIYQIIAPRDPEEDIVNGMDKTYFTNNIVTITDELSPTFTINGVKKSLSISVDSYNIQGNNNKPITYNNNKYDVFILKLSLINPKKTIRYFVFDPNSPLPTPSPTPNQTTPTPNQTTPTPKQPTPTPNQPTPTLNQPISTPNQPMPTLNQPTLIPNQSVENQQQEPIENQQPLSKYTKNELAVYKVKKNLEDLRLLNEKKLEIYEQFQKNLLLLQTQNNGDIESLEAYAQKFM
jgi:hypothetical protein